MEGKERRKGKVEEKKRWQARREGGEKGGRGMGYILLILLTGVAGGGGESK